MAGAAAMGPSGQLYGQLAVEQKPRLMDEAWGAVHNVQSEEELNAFVTTGSDIVVKLAFTWCRACKFFMPKFQKLAKIYKHTIFLTLVGNANESCKHYASKTLQVKNSPMFALYSNGRLVETWTGADPEHFVRSIEGTLPSAKGRMVEAVRASGLA